MELFKAHNQWATRPDDERFESISSAETMCKHYQESARERVVPYGDLRVEASNGEIGLVGKAGVPATLTNWGFSQLAQKSGAPAGYLRELPATLAAQNINHGLAKRNSSESAHLLFHQNGSLVLRSMTSERYVRVWNGDVLANLRQSLPEGWKTPPARPVRPGQKGMRKATAADVISAGKLGGLAIREGDDIAPAGVYASDHDLFVFQVNETNPVDDGTGHQLHRGFMLWNSEVGAASFGLMTFLYDAVCGNHIVWDARNVRKISLRHIGKDMDARARRETHMSLVSYADESASETEAQIRKARAMILGTDQKSAVEALIKLLGRSTQVSKGALENAYDAAKLAGRYGNPGSVWGMVNGLTEVSQLTPHADERVKLDKAAGKIMEVVF